MEDDKIKKVKLLIRKLDLLEELNKVNEALNVMYYWEDLAMKRKFEKKGEK